MLKEREGAGAFGYKGKEYSVKMRENSVVRTPKKKGRRIARAEARTGGGGYA